MGENSAITWTDNTFNPWIGCTKVSAGCKFCYADRENGRYQWNPAGWGPLAPRKRTSEANWKKPLQWNRTAEKLGRRLRVFCASLADVFDDHPSIEPAWRTDLFKLITATSNLDWLLLTKRPERIIQTVIWFSPGCRPPDNVRFGTSIEDQETADKRTPELLKVSAPNFLSAEPLLGPVTLDLTIKDGNGAYGYQALTGRHFPFTLEPQYGPKIDWVVAGGESGPNARPMHPDWIRSLRDQCVSAGVPFHFKQWGEYHYDPLNPNPNGRVYMDQTGKIYQSTDDLQYRAGRLAFDRVGKKAAGRQLDGRTWDEFPQS